MVVERTVGVDSESEKAVAISKLGCKLLEHSAETVTSSRSER